MSTTIVSLSLRDASSHATHPTDGILIKLLLKTEYMLDMRIVYQGILFILCEQYVFQFYFDNFVQIFLDIYMTECSSFQNTSFVIHMIYILLSKH